MDLRFIKGGSDRNRSWLFFTLALVPIGLQSRHQSLRCNRQFLYTDTGGIVDGVEDRGDNGHDRSLSYLLCSVGAVGFIGFDDNRIQ